MKAKRVLLIGWDAADWKVIDQLIERGQMPTLEKMIQGGVRGNLSTLEPALSPMLWTSIATGKFADKHGIHGFTEPDYDMGIVRPISSATRKSRAVWNILTQQEKKCNVFSWWPSNPAEPINGVMVSNLYQKARKPIDEPWPMAKGTVYPTELRDHFAKCRVHPHELTSAHIAPLIPNIDNLDKYKEKRVQNLLAVIADAASVHAASTWALENTEWDFTAIYHDAIDHACHGFMKFRAPQLPGMPDDMFENYQHVVDGVYRFHDMMLERTLQLAGPETNVILISDHGFHSDHLRPLKLPKEPAAPAFEHRKHGIFCCFGPDFKKGETIYGSSVLDITPTLLTLFGLPLGKDMDGTPLLQAFQKTPEVKYIPTWQDVEGDFGEHDPDDKIDPDEARDAVKQLVELGYVEDIGDDMKKAMENTSIELKYNLSRVYISTDRPNEALPLLLEINELKPEYRFKVRIADCYKRIGDFKLSHDWLNEIEKEDKDKQYNSALGLQRAEIFKIQGQFEEALNVLYSLDKSQKNSFTIIRSIAECDAGLGNWKSARDGYKKCLAADPHDAGIYVGLAQCYLFLEEFELAIDHALSATELIYQYPQAHFILGKALYKIGAVEMAVKSLEVAQSMRPNYNAPRLLLAEIEETHGNVPTQSLDKVAYQDIDSATLDKKLTDSTGKSDAIKSFKGRKFGEIIVVSGLPRSGTSLMMQILKNAGIQIFTDEVREADENNPRGFYEHESVKALAKKNGWLKQASGKVVKVVSPLIKYLPPNFDYKVIVMKRRWDEITLSQHKMLVKAGKAKAENYPVDMEQRLEKQYLSALKWMRDREYFQVLEVDFQDCIESPEQVQDQLEHFLTQQISLGAITEVVDKSLHRNKVASS